MAWDVIRQNLDWHGEVEDEEPTGYMHETEEDARADAADLNATYGSDTKQFIAVKVDD